MAADGEISPGITARPIRVVGIGGSLRVGSQSELALEVALAAAAAAGAETVLVPGHELVLPFYEPGVIAATLADDQAAADRATRLVETIRSADGVIIASPGYHGTISGLVKNALDYVEELREDSRPYLDGRAVGTIGVAYGWQAAVTTLTALRSIVHALRGWPTPLGVSINSATQKLAPGDAKTSPDTDEAAIRSLQLLGTQVATFAIAQRAANAPAH